MGEWKATITTRVAPELHDKLDRYARQEYRSLGNLNALLLEWAYKQLEVAGSVRELLKCGVKEGKHGK